MALALHYRKSRPAQPTTHPTPPTTHLNPPTPPIPPHTAPAPRPIPHPTPATPPRPIQLPPAPPYLSADHATPNHTLLLYLRYDQFLYGRSACHASSKILHAVSTTHVGGLCGRCQRCRGVEKTHTHTHVCRQAGRYIKPWWNITRVHLHPSAPMQKDSDRLRRVGKTAS